MEQRNENHIQYDVYQRRDDQEIERPLGVTRRTQNVGAHIVQDLGNHPEEVDAQIQSRIPQNLLGGAHQPQDRLGREQPQHGEQRADDHTEHECRVHLAVHRIDVPGTVTLSHHHTGAAAKTYEQAYQ